MILVKMKKIAKAYLDSTVLGIIITVPTHFDGSQRQAARDVGIIAGFSVLRVINEATIAAITYGL